MDITAKPIVTVKYFDVQINEHRFELTKSEVERLYNALGNVLRMKDTK